MVVIVIPAYNEEKTIGRVISGLFEHGYRTVVVIDDGSTDTTSECARAVGALVFRHSINRGQGAALETGNEVARHMGAEYVVHFDGDGQFNPGDIASALALARQEEIDVVLGSRFLDSRSELPWSKRFIILPLARCINKILTGVQLTDSHNGFRVLSKKALSLLRITHDRMAHNSEIVAQLRTHRLVFKEIPVEVSYTRYGQGVRGGFKILYDWFFHSVS